MPRKKAKKRKSAPKLKKGQCKLMTFAYKQRRCVCRYKNGRVRFHKTSACQKTYKRSQAAKRGRRRRKRR